MSAKLQLELLAARKKMSFAYLAKRIGMTDKKFRYRAEDPNRFELGYLIKMAAAFRMSIETLIKELRVAAESEEILTAMIAQNELDEAKATAEQAQKDLDKWRIEQAQYSLTLKEAHEQLGRDMKSGEYEKEGYVSPLITVRKQFDRA